MVGKKRTIKKRATKKRVVKKQSPVKRSIKTTVKRRSNPSFRKPDSYVGIAMSIDGKVYAVIHHGKNRDILVSVWTTHTEARAAAKHEANTFGVPLKTVTAKGKATYTMV